jgi:hypothetical protein
MGQEKCREASVHKSLVAGWGTSHELAALHNMPHDSELFQNILKELPFNMDWDEEDHLTLLFDTRAFAEGRTACRCSLRFRLAVGDTKQFVFCAPWYKPIPATSGLLRAAAEAAGGEEVPAQ